MTLVFKNPEVVAEPAAGYQHMSIIPANKRHLILAGQIGNLPNGILLLSLIHI